MTWGEFKKQMDTNGVLDTDIIKFIDVDHPDPVITVDRYKLAGSKTLIGVEVSDYVK